MRNSSEAPFPLVSRDILFLWCLNGVQVPSGFIDVGGGVSEGEVVFCDDYSIV